MVSPFRGRPWLVILAVVILLVLCAGSYAFWPKGPTAPPTSTPAPPATSAPASTPTVVVPPSTAQKVTFPASVWRNNVAQADPRYDVVYDPSQSGSADLPAKGWWYQPNLPGPHREAHEVAIILQSGEYRYVGPECTAWLNWDGNHPFDQGRLLVDRQNVDLQVPATQGHGTEAWVFVRCRASDASGFSFALR